MASSTLDLPVPAPGGDDHDGPTLVVQWRIPTAHDKGQVSALAVTPEGGQVFSAGSDGLVKRWAVGSGSQAGEPIPAGAGSMVDALSLHPDGRTVTVGTGDGSVLAWDRYTRMGAADPLPVRYRSGVWSLAHLADGRLITAGFDGVNLWDDDGRVLPLPPDVAAQRNAVLAVAPDGRVVVGGSGGTIFVLSNDDLLVQKSVPAHSERLSGVGSLAVVGRDRLLSSDAEGTVRLWSLDGLDMIEAVTAHRGPTLLTFLSDAGLVVTAGVDGWLRLWDPTDLRPIGRFVRAHPSGVTSLAAVEDGTCLVTGGADGSLWKWSVDGREPAEGFEYGGPVQVCAAGGQVVVEMCPRTGRVVCGTVDGHLRVWDLDRWLFVGGSVPAHKGRVLSIATTLDGTVVSGGDDGAIHFWHPDGRGVDDPIVAAHGGGVRALAVAPDGTVVSGGGDGLVRTWPAGSRSASEAVIKVRGHSPVQALVLTRNMIAAGTRAGYVETWDRVSRRPGPLIEAHVGEPASRGVRSLAPTADGEGLVSGGQDGRVRVWNLADGTEGVVVEGHPESHVISVAVTVDGQRIISGGRDGAVTVWDRMTGTKDADGMLSAPPGLTSLVVRPSDSLVVGGTGEGYLQAWKPFGPRRVEQYTPVLSDGPSPVDRLGMTKDARTVAALLTALASPPPLSVALIGNWGIGKSTFMDLLRDQVSALSGSGRADPVHATTVRQVRFNAWHYSDDHLWTGLVEHLFYELRSPRPSDGAVERPSPKELARRTAELDAERARRDRTRETLDEVDRLDRERGVLPKLIDFRRALLLIRLAGANVREELSRRDRVFAVLGAVLTVAVSAAAIWQGGLLAWAASVVTAVGAVFFPVRQIGRTVAQHSTQLRERIVLQQEGRDERIRGLEDKLAELDPSRRLDTLLTEISATDRYSAYRGLTGRIHHDLDRLSRHLAATSKESRRGDWRIVLYIDDLDRCTAPRVVEVLQAINLLLSMELFMVVVAVDPRWLLRAIDEYHGSLLHGSRSTEQDRQRRALDYLDKIFHVPFAVRPNRRMFAEHMREMLGPPVEEHGRREPTTPTAPDGTPPQEANPPEVVASAPVVPPPSASTAGDRVPGATGTARVLGPLFPEPLGLTARELDFLAEVAGVLPTPRTTKKLANLYRLVRLGIPDHDRGAFLDPADDGGPFQAVALLLAVLVSEPGQVGELLLGLRAADPDSDVVVALRYDPRRGGPASAWSTNRAVRLLTTAVTQLLSKGPVHSRTSTYQRWARTIARHCFETYELFDEV